MLMVFNSGKCRMAGHGSLSGWLAFGNANEVALSMGANEVLPVVKDVPVICSQLRAGCDPRDLHASGSA